MNLREFYLLDQISEADFETVERIVNSTSKNVKYVDPATVYQAYQTGKAIFDMLNTKKSEQEKLMKYLKTELQLIKRLLYDVIERLEELKVFIHNEFRNHSVIKLGSILQIFEESYQTWWKFPNQLNVQEASDTFLKLREYNRDAQKYGYAHFNCIWLGVIHEIILLYYFDRPKDEVARILYNHSTYFKNANDAAISGSVKQSLNFAALQIKLLRDKYPAKTFVSEYWNPTTRGRCSFYMRQTLVIEGDLATGYNYSISEPVEIRRECEGGGPHKELVSLNANKLDLGSIIDSYNNARLHYLNKLVIDYQDCKTSSETCTYYATQLDSMYA
jgi:hypothetical protein